MYKKVSVKRWVWLLYAASADLVKNMFEKKKGCSICFIFFFYKLKGDFIWWFQFLKVHTNSSIMQNILQHPTQCKQVIFNTHHFIIYKNNPLLNGLF